MNQKQPLCRRARDLDYIARPDQEAADRLSGSQFCFVVLHYLNARRSLPPGRVYRDKDCLLEEPGVLEGACRHLFWVSFPFPRSAGCPVPIASDHWHLMKGQAASAQRWN